MNRRSVEGMTMAALAALLLAVLPALTAQSQDKAELALKAAMDKETVDGNLKTAIEDYKKLSQGANKPVAARALVRLGECYEKQGNADARKTYEQVLSKFGDQKEAVAQARARLAALGGGGQTGQKAMRVVWTGPKVDGYESSVSPDGRYISFPDWDTGNLGLHDVVTGADRLLTNNGTIGRAGEAFAEVSAISRDGKQVAYAWYDEKLGRYELRVTSINGDARPRRLFEDKNVDYIEPRDWSPDGKWIAAYLSTYPSSKRTHEIGLIGAQDGSLRLLKSGSDNLTVWGFSSDGKYVVYSSRTGSGAGRDRAYIISADGKSEVPLLPGNSSSRTPVWTPDGSRIVFVSDRSGSEGLWSVHVTDGKPVGEPGLLVPSFDADPMGFARDGSLFYESGVSLTDIYLAGLDPATGKLTSEPRRINERVGNSWGRIAWLPDGKALSFWNRGPLGALVEHTLSNGEEREIWGGKSGRVGSGYSGWFPDGRTIMGGQISGQTSGQTLTFRRMDSSTGEVKASWTVPALPTGSANPIYSPDLMTMYFTRKDETVPCEGSTCTFVMAARELETGRDREIFRIKAIGLRGQSISRDGRQIAFIISDGLGNSVMVASTVEGQPRELYRATERPYFALTAWTQDGGHVLTVHPLDRGGEVWSLPTKGGSPEKSALRIQPSEAPAVSPDGAQIAFVGGGGSSEIWVMTGLLQDTKPAAAR